MGGYPPETGIAGGPSVSAPASDPTSISEGGLPRTTTLGILGGGQLGKMLASEAARMGVAVKVLDPTPNCPAAVVAEQVVGSFRDPQAVRDFAAGVDVLTVEIEHVDVPALEAAARQLAMDIEPTPATLELIQSTHL
ncbi:hypothetical protein WJX84_000328 [Apatococcus fuscideae]|uniref:PurT/PurK-like preATP-grasp domain-containing protein n=1 Tax=Apatococcus fuscideae TaxID=2026836 RepID=A0AAW1RHW1_9CHLO